MLNPTANSWILPTNQERRLRAVQQSGSTRELDNTEFFARFKEDLREHGMLIKNRWQPAVTFNSMIDRFLFGHFNKKTLKELRHLCDLLNLRVTGTRKMHFVEALASYYEEQIECGTGANWSSHVKR